MKNSSTKIMKTMRALLLIAVVSMMSLASYGQEGNKISITVKNVKSSEGDLLVGLFSSEKDFLNKAYKETKLKAEKGTMIVSFDDVPVGTYAVSIIHDENSNGDLDKNMMGIPNEPYGVSKDGKNMFGPPSYDGAKFTVANEEVQLVISL